MRTLEDPGTRPVVEGAGDVVAEIRDRAWKAYAESPLPERASHLWRYTEPEPFDPTREALSALVPLPAPERRAPEGVELLPLLEALEDESVRDRLGGIVGADHGRFEALNLAAFTGGTLLRIPAGKIVEEPVDLRAEVGAGPLEVRRTLVLVEPGAEVTILAGRGGGEEGVLLSHVTELYVGAGARVRYVEVHAPEPGVRSLLTQRARLERDAGFLQMLATTGGGTTKIDTGSVLAGPGAEVGLYGFALGVGRQHMDHHTVHEHRSSHTRSDLDFKVVLRDRARSAYTGNIKIVERAGSSEAHQENRNLLLSERARAESIPELEILTDDVSCSHGATTGPIDEQEVFYLTSRGLSPEEAVRLIVSGFVEPTLRRVPEDLAEELRAEVERRVANA